MNKLLELINLNSIIEFLPVLIVGVCVSLASFVSEDDEKKSVKSFLKHFCYSVVLCIIIFMMLDIFRDKISYIARTGISAVLAFFGIDKAIGYLERLLEVILKVKR